MKNTFRESIVIGAETFIGYRIPTPNTCALLIGGRLGFLACAYFDVAIAEKIGDPAAIVTGVRSFDDMCRAAVVRVSSTAEQLGVRVGMTGQDALLKFGGCDVTE